MFAFHQCQLGWKGGLLRVSVGCDGSHALPSVVLLWAWSGPRSAQTSGHIATGKQHCVGLTSARRLLWCVAGEPPPFLCLALRSPV